MMKNKFKNTGYHQIKSQIKDIYSVTPNDLYIPWLTFIYKLFTKPLKSFPFKIYLPASIIIAGLFFVIFGYLITKLASLLQYGF